MAFIFNILEANIGYGIQQERMFFKKCNRLLTMEDELKIAGSANEVLFVPVGSKVVLKVIHFIPEEPKIAMPVVMVTGLMTVMESFQKVLAFLTPRIPLIYIETREKSSSSVPGDVSFGIEIQGKDIAAVVKHLKLKEQGYFMLGYSYGATIIAASYKFLSNKPRGIIFLEPTPVFHYPRWSVFVVKHFGLHLYAFLKPLAKWYLGKFYINKKEDDEMAVISSKSMDNANPHKFQRVIIDIAGYQIWPMLGFIDCKALVVGTSKDGLHVNDEVERMVNMLKNASYVDLETNLRTHSEEMGKIAFSFFEQW